MLILQDKNSLEEQQRWLYEAYAKTISNIVKKACDVNSTIDPFASGYFGKNSIQTESNYYNSLLEITSYFWASKGGRGKLLEKTISSRAGVKAKHDVYLSDFLDVIIQSNGKLQGNTLNKFRKKFDLINLVDDSLIILEIKNRIDSGGVSGRRDALNKFFDVLNKIEDNTVVFVDSSQKEYTLTELLIELGIKKLEMLMGLFYNIKGNEATIVDDRKNGGFYSESKRLGSDFARGKLGITHDSDWLRIDFTKDSIEFVIQTTYGSDSTKRFTGGSLTLDMVFDSVFPKSWDDIRLALNVGITQRNLLLQYKTNHIMKIQSLYNTNSDFKSEIDRFRNNPDNLSIIKNLTCKIQNGGGNLIYRKLLNKIFQTAYMYMRGLSNDLRVSGFPWGCPKHAKKNVSEIRREKPIPTSCNIPAILQA